MRPYPYEKESMPNKFPIPFGAVVALTAQSIAIGIYRHRITNLVTLHNQLVDEHNSLIGQMSYMCHVLNENNIELNEFDLIALPAVRRKEDQN